MSTKYLLWFTGIVVTWINFNQEKWLSKNVLNHDVAEYYAYLPAAFYQHELTLEFLDDPLYQSQGGRMFPTKRAPNGNRVIKMSMGMAISYAPFFGLAHCYVKLTHQPLDPYSSPYQFAIQFSTLFYYLLGLYFLSKIMHKYFRESIVILTLFCITFGTNVLYYLTISPGLTHIVGFAFVSIFMWYTIKWYEDRKLIYAVLVGLSCGYLVLVRPINLLVVIFFVFYQLSSRQDVKLRSQLYQSHFLHLTVMLLSGILAFLPQMLYWKYVTGDFIFYSYVDERFYFNNPHVFKALFGFRKGWLVYTPIMSLALIGQVLLFKYKREFSLAISLLFLTYIYVAFSWWCWWYGGSFSQRVLIDIYPILTLPFATSIYFILESSKIFKRLSATIIIFLLMLNLLQTIQAKYNILHYDSMTRENYWQIFFTITTKPDRDKYLQKPNIERAMKGLEED